MLDPKPDVNQFILNLDDYVSIYPPIEHHLESVSYFLGDDLSIYDRIYTMKEISQLEADVRERTGRADFSVPKRNSSPNEIKVTLDDLSDAAFEKLISWLEPEYELLSQWFTPPRRDPQKLQQTGTI